MERKGNFRFYFASQSQHLITAYIDEDNYYEILSDLLTNNSIAPLIVQWEFYKTKKQIILDTKNIKKLIEALLFIGNNFFWWNKCESSVKLALCCQNIFAGSNFIAIEAIFIFQKTLKLPIYWMLLDLFRLQFFICLVSNVLFWIAHVYLQRLFEILEAMNRFIDLCVHNNEIKNYRHFWFTI